MTMKVFLFTLCALQGMYFIVAKETPETCPKIVSRSEWGAREPAEIDYALIPVENVIVHHTVTPSCDDETSCSKILKTIQNFHLEDLEFPDIGYNFLVGGDGKIYEGSGWHKIGAHTRGYNSRSLGLAFIGNFSEDKPNSKMIQAAKSLLSCGVELEELSTDYKLFGARQVSVTQSPGLKLYRELQTWTHFTRSP